MNNERVLLIEEAQRLMHEEYDSPRVHLWEHRAKSFVQKNYGDDYLDMFERALDWGSVITYGEGPLYHARAMSKAIEFLTVLQSENPVEIKSVEAREQSAPAQSSRNVGKVTITGGNVFFGDGATLTQVHVKDIIEEISKQVEDRVSDGEQKLSVLKGLKELTTNETFASVTGAFVGEVLKSLTR
jgi:hypothetical protein